ncbi:MAG TPA: hypothetical protein VIV06_11320 [Candidatus Limnocylindrales bacterium]
MTDPVRRLTPVVRIAPAKLNLTLAMGGRRPDGFHALHSVMVPLALADRLSLAVAGGPRDSLHVDGNPDLPVEGNFVLGAIELARAAVAVVRRVPVERATDAAPILAARLEKRIPVAAGLAGGSSDAAAALDGAFEAWGAEVAAGARRLLAAQLGSDVPFFLARGPALVEGRGERVTPLPPPRGNQPAVLLVTPARPVSTADVFAAFAAGVRPASGGASRAASEHLASELGRLSAQDLVARAGVLASANDLIPATLAVYPALVGFRRAVMRTLGRPVGQSGSGPTCWVIYPSIDDAEGAAADLRRAVDEGRVPPVAARAPFIHATRLAEEPERSEP